MTAEEKLKEGLKGFTDEFHLSDEMLNKLEVFYKNLVEWNEKINLTTIIERDDVYTKHFMDSLSILRKISPDNLNGKRMIDIGTGAGFPGLVLAICFPDLTVTLMDSLNKRINFLNDTITKVDAKNVVCIHSRAEELAKNKSYREKYDYAVSRAVANLSTLSEYCIPFVKIGGMFVSYKSEKVDEEIEAGTKAIQELGGKISNRDDFILPKTSYKRTILYIQKVRRTSDKYPRKAGTPSKEPIGYKKSGD